MGPLAIPRLWLSGSAQGRAQDSPEQHAMKRSIVTALALAAVASASLAGTAEAGYSTVQQCTALSGTIHYTPSLKKAASAVTETITGTISGCSGQNGAQAGSGTFFAQLSSPAASKTANNESGTFVINWPAASGLNPTTGRISTIGPNAGPYLVQGQDTAGAYTSAVLSTSWVVTGQTLGGKKHNQIVAETFTNALPLAIKVNLADSPPQQRDPTRRRPISLGRRLAG